MKPLCPRECPKRCVGCHAHCPDYAKKRKELDEINAQRRKESLISSYTKDMSLKITKNLHCTKGAIKISGMR